MSFTFIDLCSRNDSDYAKLQRRTDACSRLGRSYELPCRLPSFCVPQDVMVGFWRSGNCYLLYTRPRVFFYNPANPLAALFTPHCSFSSFAALTKHLHYLGQTLQLNT